MTRIINKGIIYDVPNEYPSVGKVAGPTPGKIGNAWKKGSKWVPGYDPSPTGPSTGGPTVVAPENTSIPTITGIAQVGVELVGAVGAWTGTNINFTPQYRRDGAIINGANSLNYIPVVADIGKFITLQVVGSNSAGSDSAISLATSAVIAAASGGDPDPEPTDFPATVNNALPNYQITLAVGQTAYPPEFNLTETSELLSGDRLWIKRTDSPSGLNPVYYSHLLTDGDLNTAPPITLTFPGMSDIVAGTYNYTPYVERADARSSGGLAVSHGPDNVKPIVSNTIPASGVTATGANVGATSNEDGFLHVVLVDSNTMPTASQIKLGKNAADVDVLDFHSAVIAGEPETVVIAGGTSGNTDHIFYASEDATGNLSDPVYGGTVTFLLPTSVWDTASKLPEVNAPNYAFTNDNRTVTQTNPSGPITVTGTQENTTGKKWIEYACYKADPGLRDTSTGVLMTFNGNSDDSGPGNPWNIAWSEDREYKIRFEVDFDNDQVQVFADNVSGGTHAFPASFGASLEAYTYVGGVVGRYITINTGQDVPMGTVTAGFEPWG